jgi:hypothetical protein
MKVRDYETVSRERGGLETRKKEENQKFIGS